MSIASLAPGFLIAPPSLRDPNFARTVVLLAVHDEGGALGFVINRASPLTVRELLEMAGYRSDSEAPVLVGGPVQPSSVWVLAEGAHHGHDVLEIGPRLFVTSSRPALDAFAAGHGGLLLAGYSGWGPGQLEGELAAGAWLPVPVDEDIVLDTDLDAKWERAYALHGLTPAALINMRGGGQA